MTAAVVTRGLTRAFGDVLAVDGVDLHVPAGSLFGLLGADGAGKSTLIRLLVTVLAPTSGSAEVLGVDVARDPGAVRPRIGYMSQQFSMYPDLSVAENVEFFATLRGVPRAQRGPRARALLEAMGLAEFSSRRAGALSGGMKQKLLLAATLMHEPRLILLDEPTTGVDPRSRREFWEILARLRERGTTAVVATPYMDEAAACTDLVFLEAGRVRRRGTPAQITGLVPGAVLEVSAADRRVARAALEGVPGVQGVHLHGDVVRARWCGGGADPAAACVEALASVGVAASAEPVPVDLEAAFAYLAEGAPPVTAQP